MSTTRFKNDPVPQKGFRFLLWLQIGAVVTVLGLSLLDLFSTALAISFLVFNVLIAILHGLYVRYQSIPVVQQRREMQRTVLHWQQKLRIENLIIQTAKTKRQELLEAEKKEIISSLNHLQQDHIQNGLANSFIRDATIPGIGPKLKEGLAGHGIVSAAQISRYVSEIPVLDEAQRQALLCWRNTVFARLDSTKPDRLPDEQLAKIKQEYQPFHEQNNTTAMDAEARSILWSIRLKHGPGIRKKS
jgi:DNA-binding helix-hairpin-helix protein with protein kinase domain